MQGAKSWVWQASIDSDGDDMDDYANQVEVFILLYWQQASSARSVISRVATQKTLFFHLWPLKQLA